MAKWFVKRTSLTKADIEQTLQPVSLVKYNVKNSGNRDEVNRQLLTKKSKRRHRIFTPNAAWLTTLRGGITEAN
jgi:hypothetical protein